MASFTFLEELLSAQGLSSLLDSLMQEVKRLSHCDGVIVTVNQNSSPVCKGLLLPPQFEPVKSTYINVKFPLISNADNELDVTFIDAQSLQSLDPFIKDRFEKWEMATLWAFPILLKQEVIGNLLVFYNNTVELQSFTSILANIEAVLSRSANLIAQFSLLDQLQLHQILYETQRSKNEFFIDAISTINSITNSEEMYNTLLKQFLRLTDFDFSLIYLRKNDNLIPEAVYYTNPQFKPVSERFLAYLKTNPYTLTPEDGTVPTAFLHNEHYYFPDIFKIIHVQMSEKSRRVLEIMGTPRSAFHTPILFQGRPIGVLTLGSVEKPVELLDTDIEQLKLMASFVGSAIKNAELYTQIENMNKNLEHRIAEQTEEIQNRLQKYAALADFLSNMSHELRTPMNAILGFTQLLSYEENLTQRQQQNVQEIHRASKHLLDLINDVLDLSRIESGRLSLSMEPVLPQRIINDCVRLMEPLARAHQVTLSVKYNNEENTFIRADAIRLRQALLNLISNAIKYNLPNGHVTVELTRLKADGQLEVAVEDTGIGIPILRQDEVFQPFNRLGAESGEVEGSGVGLLITKRLVELMHGHINFVSHQGEGSRFFIRLPILTDYEEAIPDTEPEENDDDKMEGLAINRPKLVLYVEDNPSNIRVMQQFFTHHPQLELDIAEEAVLGLYKARVKRPDLIIMDINLPGMDGFEALNILRHDQATKSIPVIALSANAMPQDIERGNLAGFDRYLTKPLNFNSFTQTLNQLLGDQPGKVC